MGRGWQSFEVHTINMDVKGCSDEISDRNEEHVTGTWKEGNPYCKVVKNLAEWCSSVL